MGDKKYYSRVNGDNYSLSCLGKLQHKRRERSSDLLGDSRLFNHGFEVAFLYELAD